MAVAVSAAAVLVGGVVAVPNANADPAVATADDFMPVHADGDYFYALCAEPVKITSLDRDGEETLQVPEKLVPEVSRILALGEKTFTENRKRPTEALSGIGLALSETGLVEGAQTIKDDKLPLDARALYRLAKTNVDAVPMIKVEETAAFPLKGTSVETGKETTCTGIPVLSNTEPDGGTPPSSQTPGSTTRSAAPSESETPETETPESTTQQRREPPSSTTTERPQQTRRTAPADTSTQTTESTPPSRETTTERTTVVPPERTVTETQSVTPQRTTGSETPPPVKHVASQIVVTVKDTSDALVSGAVMQIKDERDVVLAQWKSGDQPVTLVGETNREYTIHQVSAPEGLEVSRDLTFSTGDKEQTVVTVVNSNGQRAKIESVPTGPIGDVQAVSIIRWGGDRR